jgi:hypothetical protein
MSPATPIESSQERIGSIRYRAVKYYDGDIVRILETRRREGVEIAASNPEEHNHPRTSGTRYLLPTVGPAPLNGPGPGSRSRTIREQSTNPKHVTTKLNAKPVVVHATAPNKIRKSKSTDNPAPKVHELPTPPPTPRMGRLETPELSDLEDNPFCDCCQDVRLVKYCASCGSRLNET